MRLHIKVLAGVLLFQLIASCPLAAQKYKAEPKEPWSIGGNLYYGVLFRYRSGLPPLNYTSPVGVEMFVNRHTIGKRHWEKVYNCPVIGVALSYYNYGVPDELGEAFALTPYLDKSLMSFRNSNLRLNLGTGIVYSTRYYTLGTNELNMAIGSPITFALQGNLKYEVPLTRHSFLNFSLSFRHFSNGGLNKPNNGMNFPLVGMGIRYQPNEVKYLKSEDTVNVKLNRNIRLNIRVASGRKEVLREDIKHPVYALSLYASRRINQKSTLLFGADAFHDSAIREEFINSHQPIPNEELDGRMAGITIGHELHLAKLSFVFQLGRYVYEPNDLFPAYYQRYGLKYGITDNLSLSGMLMAHTRTANVIEWGVGLML